MALIQSKKELKEIEEELAKRIFDTEQVIARFSKVLKERFYEE